MMNTLPQRNNFCLYWEYTRNCTFYDTNFINSNQNQGFKDDYEDMINDFSDVYIFNLDSHC